MTWMWKEMKTCQEYQGHWVVYQGCWGNNMSKRTEVEISIEYMYILKKNIKNLNLPGVTGM